MLKVGLPLERPTIETSALGTQPDTSSSAELSNLSLAILLADSTGSALLASWITLCAILVSTSSEAITDEIDKVANADVKAIFKVHNCHC